MNKENLEKGTRIYYTGDMANDGGCGIITSQQQDKFGVFVNLKMDDGREFNGLTLANFSDEYLGHCGIRFVTEKAYNKYRQQAIGRALGK
jgi:hypothetical protein